MPDVISLLPESIANQIAAGEVVQRPASVVKELMENAIDAGADNIRVVVKDAGKTLIQVIDNGSGMSETDVRMSLERHATSKIRESDDLFHIKTMGFRGEALASIAAVSKVEVKTKTKGAELGTMIRVEGSEFKKQEAVNCDEGTAITIKNLFYNVPARRKFLKSNPVELKHILEEFTRIALSLPGVAFSFYQNDMETYHLPPGKLSYRIINLFNKNYQEQLAACQEETPLLKISGYVGKPDYAKKTRGEQYIFVNRRYIKSNYLNHAVIQAYEGLIPGGTYPFYVLFLEIDPVHVDINVHPTKTEIKFDDERSVYGLVQAAVKKALAAYNFTPSIDFESNVNFDPFAFHKQGGQPKNLTSASSQQHNSSFKKHNPAPQDWQELYKAFENTAPAHNTKEETYTLRFESDIHNISENTGEKEDKTQYQNTFQLHKKYIITQVKSGLMLIDQHAAHERILYERYINAETNSKNASQQNLFTEIVELNAADYHLLKEIENEIKELGFSFSFYSNNTIGIDGMPAEIKAANPKELFEGLLEQFKSNKAHLQVPVKENLVRSLAKKAALTAGLALSIEEMNAIIEQLLSCSVPNYTPDGKSVILMLDLEKIDAYFSTGKIG